MDLTSLPTLTTLGWICCGVFSLLYGAHLATEVLTGPQFRRSLIALSQRPSAAFGVGIVVTMLTQSSGATSSLLVGLVSVRLLPLTVAITAMLGANIGSALALQLVAFHITRYALIFVALGCAVALFTRRTSRAGLGQILLGFGLLVLGLAALEVGGNALATTPATALILSTLAPSPLILALIGVVLTIIFSSSVAGIGLVVVLVSHGTLSLESALPLLLGANVGSTITALMTALLRGSSAGRRLALLHTTTKLVVAAGLLTVLPYWATVLATIPLPAGTLVALAHLVFNLALALLFVPCARLLEILAQRVIPDRKLATGTGSLYLRPEALLEPAEALGQATREVLHMTDLVTTMLNFSIRAFEDQGGDIPGLLATLDDQVDELNAEITRYLTRLDETILSEQQKNRQIALLYIITSLESIGDLLDTQCMRLAQRKTRRQLIFCEEEWQELLLYHREITSAVQQVFASIATQDPRTSGVFLERKKQLTQMKQELHLRHVRRLQLGVPLSVAASSIHLDLLTTLRGILTHASTIAYVVQEYFSASTIGTPETRLAGWLEQEANNDDTTPQALPPNGQGERVQFPSESPPPQKEPFHRANWLTF